MILTSTDAECGTPVGGDTLENSIVYMQNDHFGEIKNGVAAAPGTCLDGKSESHRYSMNFRWLSCGIVVGTALKAHSVLTLGFECLPNEPAAGNYINTGGYSSLYDPSKTTRSTVPNRADLSTEEERRIAMRDDCWILAKKNPNCPTYVGDFLMVTNGQCWCMTMHPPQCTLKMVQLTHGRLSNVYVVN